MSHSSQDRRASLHAENVFGAVAASSSAGTFVVGSVIGIEPSTFRVRVDDAEQPATRALSCLVEPAVGDRILLASAGRECFILAVLDRLVPDAAELSAPGVKRLIVNAPRFSVQAEESIDLAAGRDLGLKGETVNIRAGAFSLVGRLATFILDRMKSTVRRREIVAEQLAIHADTRVTSVKGTDVSEIGTLVQKVEKISTQTAQISVMTAKDDMRLDGKRVSVG